MKTTLFNNPGLQTAALLFGLFLSGPAKLHAQSATTWTNGGVNGFWSTQGNWITNIPGSTGTNGATRLWHFGPAGAPAPFSTNDIAGLSGFQLFFDSGATNYTLFQKSGTSLMTLNDFGGNQPTVQNNSTNVQTMDMSFNMQAKGIAAPNQIGNINPTTGDLVFTTNCSLTLMTNTTLKFFSTAGHAVTFYGPILQGTLVSNVCILATTASGGAGATVNFFNTNTCTNTFINCGTARFATNNVTSFPIVLGDTNAANAPAANLLMDNGLVNNSQLIVQTLQPSPTNSRTIGNTSFGSGAATFNGPVSLGTNLTLSASAAGTLVFAGDFNFQNPDGLHPRTLTITGSGNTVVNGSLTNASSGVSVLLKTNSGALTLNGAGNGSFVLYKLGGGTISITNAAAIGVPTGVSYPDKFSFTGNATLSVTNSFTLGRNASGSDFAGFRINGGNTGTFDVANGSTFTINGPIIDIPSTGSGALAKSDSGTLILNQPNTYSGGTTVGGGTLLVNNQSGSGTGTGNVLVNSNATLGGTGTISGNVTFATGAFALFSNGSVLNISGSLILNGNTVHVALPPSTGAGTYTLANYNSAGSSGAFAATPIIDSGSIIPGATATIITSGGAVSLVISQATPFLASGPTPSSSITYGQMLGSAGLTGGSVTNAAGTIVPGTFAYATPSAVPAVAVMTATVIFTPMDTVDYLPLTNSVNISVLPASLGIMANSTSKVYGQTASFAGTEFTTSGLVGGDSVSSVMLTSGGAAMTATVSGSPYSIVPSAAIGSGLANYNITYNNGSFSVTAASLGITANSTGKIYGAAKTFAGTEFTTSGLLNGDSMTSVTLTSSGAVSNAPVASYPIVPTAAIGTGLGNYHLSYANGTLTVGPALLLVVANDTNRAYGATNPPFTSTISGFVNSDSLTNSDVVGDASLTTLADTNSVVGTYEITAALGTLASTNYTFGFTNGTLTINPAAITVTADNLSRVYGAANPALTYVYSGFTNGDDASVISGTPVLSVSADTNSNVGGYTITVASGTLSATNYSFILVNGTLSVTPASLTITANDVIKYYGTTSGMGGGFTATGLVNGDTIDSVNLSPSGGPNPSDPVGDYVIVASGAAGMTFNPANYAITYINGTYTVRPYPITVTADAQTKVYGTMDPVLTFTAVPFPGAPFTGALSRVAGETVGSYAIAQGTLSVDSNYSITFVGASLAITPAGLTITASDASKIFGQTLTFAGTEFTASGLISPDTITSVTLASSGAVASAPATNYPIVPSAAMGSGLANYTIIYVNGTLTVNPSTPVTVNVPVNLPDGTIQLTFTGGDAGVSYRVQGITDLTTTNWTDLVTNVAGTNGLPGFIDLSATNYTSRFYRTVTP